MEDLEPIHLTPELTQVVALEVIQEVATQEADLADILEVATREVDLAEALEAVALEAAQEDVLADAKVAVLAATADSTLPWEPVWAQAWALSLELSSEVRKIKIHFSNCDSL